MKLCCYSCFSLHLHYYTLLVGTPSCFSLLYTFLIVLLFFTPWWGNIVQDWKPCLIHEKMWYCEGLKLCCYPCFSLQLHYYTLLVGTPSCFSLLYTFLIVLLFFTPWWGNIVQDWKPCLIHEKMWYCDGLKLCCYACFSLHLHYYLLLVGAPVCFSLLYASLLVLLFFTPWWGNIGQDWNPCLCMIEVMLLFMLFFTPSLLYSFGWHP